MLSRKRNAFVHAFSIVLVALISFSLILSPNTVYAQSLLGLPVAGTMVMPTDAFVPVMIKGMTIHPDNALKLDFIIDNGNTAYQGNDLKQESSKLIKYFLASLTVPEKELWVNLSPNEKDRIIPDALGKTQLGQDLLAQDYLLKQLTATLMYPEDKLGAEFWEKVYKQAQEKYGTTDIPIDTFNKVWIIPQSASVYEHENTVYVTNARLKVMTDRDYLASNAARSDQGSVISDQSRMSPSNKKIDSTETITPTTDHRTLTTQIIKEIIIPAIEKEVNEGENFAPLRQIYHSLILAKWYKETLKNSIINETYSDRNKIQGIENEDPAIKEKIYRQYMEAYKKGVYDYMREDYDAVRREIVPRKYFSGGFKTDPAMAIKRNQGINPVISNPVGNFNKVVVSLKGMEDQSMLTYWDSLVQGLTQYDKEKDVQEIRLAARKMQREILKYADSTMLSEMLGLLAFQDKSTTQILINTVEQLHEQYKDDKMNFLAEQKELEMIEGLIAMEDNLVTVSDFVYLWSLLVDLAIPPQRMFSFFRVAKLIQESRSQGMQDKAEILRYPVRDEQGFSTTLVPKLLSTSKELIKSRVINFKLLALAALQNLKEEKEKSAKIILDEMAREESLSFIREALEALKNINSSFAVRGLIDYLGRDLNGQDPAMYRRINLLIKTSLVELASDENDSGQTTKRLLEESLSSLNGKDADLMVAIEQILTEVHEQEIQSRTLKKEDNAMISGIKDVGILLKYLREIIPRNSNENTDFTLLYQVYQRLKSLENGNFQINLFSNYESRREDIEDAIRIEKEDFILNDEGGMSNPPHFLDKTFLKGESSNKRMFVGIALQNFIQHVPKGIALVIQEKRGALSKLTVIDSGAGFVNKKGKPISIAQAIKWRKSFGKNGNIGEGLTLTSTFYPDIAVITSHEEWVVTEKKDPLPIVGFRPSIIAQGAFSRKGLTGITGYFYSKEYSLKVKDVLKKRLRKIIKINPFTFLQDYIDVSINKIVNPDDVAMAINLENQNLQGRVDAYIALAEESRMSGAMSMAGSNEEHYQKALKAYRFAFGEDPENVKAIGGIISCLLALEKIEEAIVFYDEVATASPGIIEKIAIHKERIEHFQETGTFSEDIMDISWMMMNKIKRENEAKIIFSNGQTVTINGKEFVVDDVIMRKVTFVEGRSAPYYAIGTEKATGQKVVLNYINMEDRIGRLMDIDKSLVLKTAAQVLAFGEDQDGNFVRVTKYLPISFRKWITAKTQEEIVKELPELLEKVLEIGEDLVTLENNQTPHGDVQHQNVRISEEGDWKLIDFADTFIVSDVEGLAALLYSVSTQKILKFAWWEFSDPINGGWGIVLDGDEPKPLVAMAHTLNPQIPKELSFLIRKGIFRQIKLKNFLAQLKLIQSSLTSQKSSEDDALATESKKGGIDFSSDTFEVSSQGNSIRFEANYDFQKVRSYQGFSPVIIELSPIPSLPALLGITP